MTFNKDDQAQENRAVNIGLTKLPRPFIEGMKLREDVRLNGVTFNKIETITVPHPTLSGETKTYEIVWVCSDIDGWWNVSNVEIPDIPRGLDDGSYDVRGRWTAKILTLKGSILVPEPYVTPYARQKLLNAINLVKTGAWLFVDESPKKAAYVRLSGQPLVSNVNARGRIDFEVQLKAGDPIKYGWEGLESETGYTTTAIGNSVTVVNEGDTPVAALFSVAGPITAPAYIRSTNDVTSEVQTIKIIKDLRSTAYSTTGVTTRELQSGVATLTIPGHDFSVGDTVDVTSITTDFNTEDVVLSGVTETTISYVRSHVAVTSISLTSNVATITTTTAHGLSSGAVIFISNSSNPLLDGQYTASTASGSSITAARVLDDQASASGGLLSKEISSTSSTGTVTFSAYTVKTITSRALQSGTATLVTGTHGFLVGDVITVASVTTDFNISGTAITAVTDDSISYTKSHVDIQSISLTSNVATITTSTSHGLSAGAIVYVSGSSNSLLNGQYTATTASGSTITASKTMANQPSATGGKLSKQITSTANTTGSIALSTTDSLEIDTYNTTVTYRGAASNSRSMLDANVSWIKLYPGNNVITFTKTGGTGNATVKYRSGWIG